MSEEKRSLLVERAYDICVVVRDQAIDDEDRYLPKHNQKDFSQQVSARPPKSGEAIKTKTSDLVKWALLDGLRAQIWEEPGPSEHIVLIYARGSTDALLDIAERIFYPLQLEMPAVTNEKRLEFADGHLFRADDVNRLMTRRQNSVLSADIKPDGRVHSSGLSQAQFTVQTHIEAGNVPAAYVPFSRNVKWTLGAGQKYSEKDVLPFRRYRIPQIVGTDEVVSYLREADRARLCYHELNMYLNIDQLQQDNLVLGCHIYRNAEIYNQLLKTWATPDLPSFLKRVFLINQPFDVIREYFGDEICLYFHFLQHCIKWLSFAAFAGVVAWAVNFSQSFVHHSRRFTITRICMSIVMSVTAALIYRQWLGTQAMLKLKYGLTMFESELTRRPVMPTFKFKTLHRDPINPDHTIPEAPRAGQQARYLVSIAVSCLAILMAAIMVNQDLHQYLFSTSRVRDGLEQHLQKLALMLNAVVPESVTNQIPVRALVTSLLAIFCDICFKACCKGLTRFENHRYHDNYQRSLIRKIFIFSAFDYFLPLYNLAFLKVHYDPCYEEDPKYGRCLISLLAQIKSMLLVALVGNVIEVGLPFVFMKFKTWKLRRSLKAHACAQQLPPDQRTIEHLEDLCKEEYTSTSGDFGEIMLILMVGLLFSSAFFSLPFFVLIVIALEVRVDATKLLLLHPRPYPHLGLSLSAWNFVLDCLMNLAIVTNISVVAFTSFGGDLPTKVKLGLCFVGLIVCIATKEAVANWGCRQDRMLADFLKAQQHLVVNAALNA